MVVIAVSLLLWPFVTSGAKWAAAGLTAAAAATLGYGVRGRSSQMFGESIWRGDRTRRAVALTFDDGPSESTPELLEVLDRHGARATFFMCGAHVRRLAVIAREIADRGHEIGNHSDVHQPCYFRTRGSIYADFARAQASIYEACGVWPRLVRAPYGARWFGFEDMQRGLGVTGVMWTVLARDWKLDADATARRVLRRIENGAIVCLHDGREMQRDPDIRGTVGAVQTIAAALVEQGYAFETVSGI